jgi:hypothetical protein
MRGKNRAGRHVRSWRKADDKWMSKIASVAFGFRGIAIIRNPAILDDSYFPDLTGGHQQGAFAATAKLPLMWL